MSKSKGKPFFPWFSIDRKVKNKQKHSIHVEKVFQNSSVVGLVAQAVKSLPAMQETWVRSLGQEDPLEKEMTTHSSFLAWRIPWMEESGRLHTMGSQRVRHD